jgi:hypothetical protein
VRQSRARTINSQSPGRQAKKVGAAIVIVMSKYQSTTTGSMPITTPTTSTAYNSGTASAFGMAAPQKYREEAKLLREQRC